MATSIAARLRPRNLRTNVYAEDLRGQALRALWLHSASGALGRLL